MMPMGTGWKGESEVELPSSPLLVRPWIRPPCFWTSWRQLSGDGNDRAYTLRTDDIHPCVVGVPPS